MARLGWQKLIPTTSPFLGEGKYRIDAYSEFTPPPRLGWKPYASPLPDPELFDPADPFGWNVGEFEEVIELQPGLLQIATQVLGHLRHLASGGRQTGMPREYLIDNPYWPSALAGHDLPHERWVTLAPIALSRTQDDKGRLPWTFFGGSEQGPGKAFWKSFYASPQTELPESAGIGFFCRLLAEVYGISAAEAADLKNVGFRVMTDDKPIRDHWVEQLPGWAEQFRLGTRPNLRGVNYLLTFRPFARLPAAIREAYLNGSLCLLPCPASLVYWGVPGYHRLSGDLPLASQIPLTLGIARHRMQPGIRVPQSGFLHEPTHAHPDAGVHAGHVRNTYRRTHRWDKIARDDDELALLARDDKLVHVLFSPLAEDVGLYDKPMARNVQLWTHDHKLVLNGPTASPAQIKSAIRTVHLGGVFGYRFAFPPMRVGVHEVYWHRPLVAFRDSTDAVRILPDAPLGYMTAYPAAQPQLDRAIELWPRLRRRDLPTAVLAAPGGNNGRRKIRVGVAKILDADALRDRQLLPRSLARQLVIPRPGHTLEDWIATLPSESIRTGVEQLIEPESPALPQRRGKAVPDSLTYRRSATRNFEVKYWTTIAGLAEGKFLNKNNADCVLDEVTRNLLPYHERQLEGVGDFLLAFYAKKINAAGMAGLAMVGEIPFRWQTDFDFAWMGGWLKNKDKPAERDLIVTIPGRDRTRAVIMSDHYDTAYMADRYEPSQGGCGARMAACGADDNHSATAAMMLAAPIFLELSKAGKLGCDVWLVHLTGEEFPADCLGARALTQRLVEGVLRMHLPGGKSLDLSGVRIEGLYVSDMIAHNNDRDRDVFQISPGTGARSFKLAEHAHTATEVWNASVPVWNRDPSRAGRPRGRRSPHGGATPEIAPFLALSGEVRTPLDPRSTLYNTDGQIFSDAGVPCVLFMENYDINRSGYHDTHDTMANIDLDYGAALCAITIESVARASSGIESKRVFSA